VTDSTVGSVVVVEVVEDVVVDVEDVVGAVDVVVVVEDVVEDVAEDVVVGAVVEDVVVEDVVVGAVVVVEVVVVEVVDDVVNVPQANQWLIAGSCPPSFSGEMRFTHGGFVGSPRSPGWYRFVSSPPLTKIDWTVKPESTLVIVKIWPVEIVKLSAESGIGWPRPRQSPGCTLPTMNCARGSLGDPVACAETMLSSLAIMRTTATPTSPTIAAPQAISRIRLTDDHASRHRAGPTVNVLLTAERRGPVRCVLHQSASHCCRVTNRASPATTAVRRTAVQPTAGGPQSAPSSVPAVTWTRPLPSALTIQMLSFEASGSDRVNTIRSPSGDQSGA
jgi:hypothetical protein